MLQPRNVQHAPRRLPPAPFCAFRSLRRREAVVDDGNLRLGHPPEPQEVTGRGLRDRDNRRRPPHEERQQPLHVEQAEGVVFRRNMVLREVVDDGDRRHGVPRERPAVRRRQDAEVGTQPPNPKRQDEEVVQHREERTTPGHDDRLPKPVPGRRLSLEHAENAMSVRPQGAHDFADVDRDAGLAAIERNAGYENRLTMREGRACRGRVSAIASHVKIPSTKAVVE